MVIEDTIRDFDNGLSPLPAYFYCSRNPAEPKRSDPVSILGSIARQLSSLQPGHSLLKPAVDMYKLEESQAFSSGKLSLDETRDLIIRLVDEYPLATIVLDALDECDPGRRADLLDVLEHVLQDASSLVKIFISSRTDQDIVLRLESYPSLEIDPERNHVDIRRFVETETKTLIQRKRLLKLSQKQETMRDIIITELSEQARGM
jgi:hypothetical protein